MANICSNHIKITGDGDQLQALLKRLLDQEPSLIKTVPNFEIAETDFTIYEKGYINYSPIDIKFCFGSKHYCPLESIALLSSEYPELTFSVHYEEGGNDLYGYASISKGYYSELYLDERHYAERYNDDYKALYNRIKFSPYKYFLRDYTHGGFDEHPYPYLDRNIIARIKDTDLPLFINRQWMDKQAHDTYKQRLSGGSTVEHNNPAKGSPHV